MLSSPFVVSEMHEQMSARVAELRPGSDLVQREMFAQIYGALFGTPPEPVMLGRYIVLERRGAGGMGTVFSAWDRALQRRVALKVLHRSHTRGREEAILREARALAKVTDPHVVAIFDVGRNNDDAWIAMEYVEGVEIGRAARQGAQSTQLAAWLAQAAMGIAAAHRAGVVHGDVKPSNILVGPDGRARVVDFGMATTEEASRFVGGTTGYLAPELFDGAAPTTAGDVFALCVTANELNLQPWPRRLARVVARGLESSGSARPSIEALAVAFRSAERGSRDRTRGAIVLGIGTLAIAAAWPGSPARDCELALAPSWQSDLRARAEYALRDAGEVGERVWSQVAPGLDARAETWTHTRDIACARAGLERVAIVQCLEAAELASAEVVESLEAGGDVPRPDQILSAAGEPADCATRVGARPLYDHEVREGLVRVQVAKALGDLRQARPLAEDLWALARRERSGDIAWRVAYELGELYMLAGQPKAARERLESAYFGALEQKDDALALDAAVLLIRVVAKAQGDLEGAERWRRAVLALIERLEPPRAIRVRSLDGLARLAQLRGDWPLARSIAERLIADAEAEHDEPVLRVRIGLLYAGILRHEGDAEGQLAELERVVAIASSYHVRDHPDIGLAQIAYGSALDDVSRAEEAIFALRQGIAILERVELFERLGDPYYLLGRALLSVERIDEAEEAFESARTTLAQVRGSGHPDVAVAFIGLAEVAAARRDLARAREHYAAALELTVPWPDDHAHVLFAIGQVDLEEKQWNAALARYREAREVFADPRKWRVMLAETWVGEARALAGRGDAKEARVAIEQARALAIGDPPIPEVISVMDQLATTL